jgi:hypothetical protein
MIAAWWRRIALYNFVFARPQTPKAADWEAGENPALPRNCKRVKSDCRSNHCIA